MKLLRPSSVLATSLVATALVFVSSSSPSAAADATMARVEASVPDDAAGSGAEPLELAENDGTYSATTSEVSTLITKPGSTAGAVRLSETEQPLKIGLPEISLDGGVLTSDRKGAVFQSDDGQVSVSVQAFTEGARIATSLESASAPTSFSYPIAVPPGGQLEETPEGMIVVADSNGDPIGYLGKPWARDAEGRDISTRYSVSGSTVTQHISHRSGDVSYPVVADPYGGKALIRSAWWDYIPRDGAFGPGYTLRVIATDWAWKLSSQGQVSAAAGHYGFKELRKKKPSLNRHLGAMRDQWICHQEYAAGYYGKRRPTWNIDEWRKDVSYWSTVRYKCNPPAGGPYRRARG